MGEKVQAGDGEDKEWAEGPSEEWKGEMGSPGAWVREGAFKQ